MSPARPPSVLPHERYVMKRFLKDPSASPKLQRCGFDSVTFDIASSADVLLAFVLKVPTIIVQIIAIIIGAWDLEYAAIAMWGTVIALYLLAMIREVQSFVALAQLSPERQRRTLDLTKRVLVS